MELNITSKGEKCSFVKQLCGFTIAILIQGNQVCFLQLITMKGKVLYKISSAAKHQK